MTEQNGHGISGAFKPFLAGACAGLAVDISLFPIDTIKTRLQSPQGFWKAGGFRQIYSGIGSTVSGSAPGAALFFFTYEASKRFLKENPTLPGCHTQYSQASISAAFGEMVACLIRVPMEVVKQRAQVHKSPSLEVFRNTLSSSGITGFYRGYGSTIMREIPFSFIQFPLWEFLKNSRAKQTGKPKCNSLESMLCGSLAGGFSAFVTTPLDVIKTRIMLANYGESDPGNINRRVKYSEIIAGIYRQGKVRAFFLGAAPRVLWISFGGAIFLGGYDLVVDIL